MRLKSIGSLSKPLQLLSGAFDSRNRHLNLESRFHGEAGNHNPGWFELLLIFVGLEYQCRRNVGMVSVGFL